MSHHSITIENLEVTYVVKNQQNEAVKNVNCTFNEGVNIVVGSSGSGKTTLLRALAHSLEYNGTINFDNENILSIKKKDLNISYVSQNFVLYPHLTIFENISFPLKNLKMDEDEINERVYDLAHLFGLTACLSRLPKHLSIGQQQRVALARALIKLPKILLLDEPFSNLDIENKEKFALLLKKVIKKRKMIAVFVSHDIKMALSIGDVFFEMEDGKLSLAMNQEMFLDKNKDLFKNL